MATSSDYETAGQFSLIFSGCPQKNFPATLLGRSQFQGQNPEKKLPFQQTRASSV
jgi:hypothetical protein